jgi:DoxX-like family
MAKVGVSESWITTLGVLKAAGALGLMIGIGVRAVGIAAAAGPRPVFYRRYHHSLARTRLLVWPGDRVPSPGNRRAGRASGFMLKKAISGLGTVLCRASQEL